MPNLPRLVGWYRSDWLGWGNSHLSMLLLPHWTFITFKVIWNVTGHLKMSDFVFRTKSKSSPPYNKKSHLVWWMLMTCTLSYISSIVLSVNMEKCFKCQRWRSFMILDGMIMQHCGWTDEDNCWIYCSYVLYLCCGINVGPRCSFKNIFSVSYSR